MLGQLPEAAGRHIIASLREGPDTDAPRARKGPLFRAREARPGTMNTSGPLSPREWFGVRVQPITQNSTLPERRAVDSTG